MSAIGVDEAVKKLLTDDVVALPTETVYGLAALINSDVALNKIFSTKNRPYFDPLIVHVANQEQAENLAFWDDVSRGLSQHFWPGPLTVVLPKQTVISDLITNGGPTVALRSPNHPIFQEVLGQLPAALAAPSANQFGKTSPTTAEHVVEEFTGSVNVVDGGPCLQGIESTVVEYRATEKTLEILRAGAITADDLKRYFNEHDLSDISVVHRQKINSPGHLKNHYQPSSPLFLVRNFSQDLLPIEAQTLLNEKATTNVVKWTLPNDPALAARKLYADLREFSKQQQAAYFMISKEMESSEKWQALLDRLQKASHGTIQASHGQWLFVEK